MVDWPIPAAKPRQEIIRSHGLKSSAREGMEELAISPGTREMLRAFRLHVGWLWVLVGNKWFIGARELISWWKAGPVWQER